ncbi:MAG: hypothetical protein ABFS46_12525 [Myxococcota bacterium]
MSRAFDPGSLVEPAHEAEVRHVFGTSGLSWVLAATLSLAGVGCPGSDPAGDAYSEKRLDGLLDDGRERRVPITVLWPARAEPTQPSPLIVLSHGGAGHRGSYEYLAAHLARHGYVVAIPEHVGSSTRALLRGMWERRSGPRAVLRAMAEDADEWRARPADVGFVIDRATRWNEADPDLRGGIDLGRVGVLGHSYGAYTALAVAGARVQLEGTPVDLSDPRVDAMVALSPSGPGGWGWFREESYRSVEVPALLVTGSRDAVMPWQSGEWRKQAFDLMPPGPRYCLWLEGVTHLDFADLPFQFRRAATVHRIVEKTTTAFFDAHLRRDASARETLMNPDRVASLAGPGIPAVRWYENLE